MIATSFMLSATGLINVKPSIRENILVGSADDWLIDNKTTIKDQTLLINKSIRVLSGGEFMIFNSTLIFDSGYDGEFYMLTESGGKLNITNNSLITSKLGFGYNITISQGGQFTFEDSSLNYAGFGKNSYISPGLIIVGDNAIIKNVSYIDISNSTDSLYSSGILIKLIGCEGVAINNIKISLPTHPSRWQSMVIEDANNITIQNSWFNNTSTGVEITNSNDIQLIGNLFTDSEFGAYFKGSTTTRLKDNVFADLGYGGVYYYQTNENFVENNTFLKARSSALYFESSDYNFVRNNSFILSLYDDLSFANSRTSLVFDNLFTQTGRGAINAVTSGQDFVITRNRFSEFRRTPENGFEPTNLLLISGVSNLLFYLNSIEVITNNFRIENFQSNFVIFNNGTHGNYWDSYTGTDDNNDGIGDSSYYGRVITPPDQNAIKKLDTRPLIDKNRVLDQIGLDEIRVAMAYIGLSTPKVGIPFTINAIIYGTSKITGAQLQYSEDNGNTWINKTMSQQTIEFNSSRPKVSITNSANLVQSWYTIAYVSEPMVIEYPLTIKIRIYINDSEGNTTLIPLMNIEVNISVLSSTGTQLPSTSTQSSRSTQDSKSTNNGSITTTTYNTETSIFALFLIAGVLSKIKNKRKS